MSNTIRPVVPCRWDRKLGHKAIEIEIEIGNGYGMKPMLNIDWAFNTQKTTDTPD